MALTYRIAAILFFCLCSQTSPAHTLPISYLTVVPDQNYVHLELTLNPFELNFFSEIDLNHDQQLSATEVEAAQKQITERLLARIKLKVDGTLVPAETAGITCDAESHHLMLRAHYLAAGANDRTVTVESDLSSITSASHLTQAVFGKGEHQQLAQLSVQAMEAHFGAPEKTLASSLGDLKPDTTSPGFVPLLLLALGALPTIGIGVALTKFIRKHLWEAPGSQ